MKKIATVVGNIYFFFTSVVPNIITARKVFLKNEESLERARESSGERIKKKK